MTVWSAIVALWAFAIGGAIGAWLMHYTGRGNAAICTVVTHHRHLLLNLTEGMDRLMESQSQLAEQLRGAVAVLEKSAGEIAGLQGEMATLNERIVALQAIIESADGASQELTDAVAAVVAQARAVDDAIPDAPVVPPIEPVDLPPAS